MSALSKFPSDQDAPQSQSISSGKDAPMISQVEATPPLRDRHHKESIACYQVDPTAKGDNVAKSNIELRRGAVIHVNADGALKLGGRVFLPVARCEIDPQAVGLFVRQEEVIPIPSGSGSIPAIASGKLNLRLIKRANKAGKPVMEISGVKLSEGTVFRVSNVHRVTPTDQGNGVIDADGTVDYYLVSECLQVPAAAGLFVQIPEASLIEEESYAKEIEQLLAPSDQLQTQHVVVAPKDSAESAYLFQEADHQDKKTARRLKTGELLIVKSHSEALAAGTRLVVETAVTLSGEKEYLRIVEYPERPDFVGMFLLVKEVTPIQDVTLTDEERAERKLKFHGK